ncbi:MAG: hypothetical protein OIF50_02500 [Flavobacteriaceae bacterium]|nr:hypothetical protein [Flavobacteriaceae bacterium]
MKILFWICSFSLFFFPSSEREKAIDWKKEQKLLWKNYCAHPNHKARAVALTSCGITYEFEAYMDPRFDFVTVDSKIKASFYPEKSWVKKGQASEAILEHEQLHFDLTEIYADKFRRIVAGTQFSSNVKEEMQSIFLSIKKELDSVQTFYDLETNFSRNRINQELWERKVTLWLSLNKTQHTNRNLQ